MRRIVVLAWILAVTIQTFAVEDGNSKTKPNRCGDATTCGQCMEAGGECGWCKQDNYDADNKLRCDLIENLLHKECDEVFIVHPSNDITSVKNETTDNTDPKKAPVQLAPQEVDIRLRPNKPYKLNVRFRQAENYPVDLYYIMDLSNSMNDDKAKLAKLGNKLAKRMSNITKNFQLGFGSFVDKKTMPYVSILESKLDSPCEHCISPYGYKHHLDLTENITAFRTEVLRANISGNLDTPEGGFDAIMQAIACKNEIGWRDQSRKLLLMATDAPFHMAGDGKLGGIVTPNDGNCHIDTHGYYSESLNQDYPSIGQLASRIKAKKVNVIFAVTKERRDTYAKLSAFIEGSTVGELAGDSSNIVELVQENYNKISSTVELKTADNDDVEVTFKTKCKGSELMDTAECNGVSIGESVDYEVTIEVKRCPKDRNDWKKSLKIYPVGLTEELKVNLDLICECDCELPDQEEKASVKCNRNGTFECGACTCDKGRYGKDCECDGSNLQSEDYDASCKQTNGSDVCSGNGQCLCGSCDCNPITPGDSSKKYSGRYCECDDFSCDYYDNKPCGGPARGKCACGECQCNSGYNGTACECAISKEPCRASNGLICNGKGSCECGKCKCDRDTYFRGPTCEDCLTCPGKCEQNKACVQCRAFKSGKIAQEDCEANCTHVLLQDSLDVNEDMQRMCQFRDDDDCIFYFAYEYNNNVVHAQRTKECPEPVDPLAISLAVIGAIVAVGLALLLIWKLFTTIHDRREFAKFEKERQNAKWDTGENPIYKQAVSNFKNPTFAGKN